MTDKMQEESDPIAGQRGRYELVSEQRSRFNYAGGTLTESVIPNDGLCRVIVNRKLPRTAYIGYVPKPVRTRDDCIDYLRASNNRVRPTAHHGAVSAEDAYVNYPGVVGLSAARLCGKQGWLWAVGEIDRRFADALPEATGADIAVIRVGVIKGLIIYRMAASDVTAQTIWLHYGGDYGLRLFAFDRPATRLESALKRLEASVRQDAPRSLDEWARMDAERSRRPRRGIAELVVRAAMGMSEDVAPYAIADTLNQWDRLKRACWVRSELRALCEEAIFCVLPDGPHHSEAAFNSVRRTANDLVGALTATLDEAAFDYRVITVSPDHRTV